MASSPRDSPKLEATSVSAAFKPKLRVPFQPITPPPSAKAVQHDASTAIKDAQTEIAGDKPNSQQAALTAEEFEQAAFKALQGKARQGRGVASKRPAGSQKGMPAKKPAMAQGIGSKHLQLGCKRCRGSQDGCGTCRNPNFKGWRGSREEWNAFGHK